MTEEPYGLILSGDHDQVRRAYDAFVRQPVDWDLTGEAPDPPERRQVTIRQVAKVTGPGTFFGREHRTLTFEPPPMPGWWFDRADLPDSLPIKVSVRNVWTTVRNIVLRSGSPHNYMRMIEHIVALRLGLGIDNLMIKADSGDPPLFDRGSSDLVEALEGAGREEQAASVVYVTVKESVTFGGANGCFVTLVPARRSPDSPRGRDDGGPAHHSLGDGGPAPKSPWHLQMDCAVNYPNVMGKQRIRFNLNRRLFRDGALARTNTTAAMKWYAQTVGKLFADIRNLGYTDKNILIAGRRRYLNEPMLVHEGKSLEAVWHRALLDLLAALALIDEGRFVGTVRSYKAGHNLDVEMVRLLYKYNLLRTIPGGMTNAL